MILIAAILSGLAVKTIATTFSAIDRVCDIYDVFVDEYLRINRGSFQSGWFLGYKSVGFHGWPHKKNSGYHSNANGKETFNKRVSLVARGRRSHTHS